jgi:predicted nucleic acid-binding protein
MPLADTLLRMAESPRLYLPKWSSRIMHEVTRNLVDKWKLEPAKAERRQRLILRHFPEALVEGFEPLIDVMTNHPKDRHVLAAAVRSNSKLIVTYNRRDFPRNSVQPFDIEVQGPSTFLRALYDFDPGLTLLKLNEQARAIRSPLERLLLSLSKNTPGFVRYLCEQQGISLQPHQTT